MFKDPLQEKLRRMEHRAPSINSHNQNMSCAYFLFRYVLESVKNIPQKSDIRRSPLQIAGEYAKIMGYDPIDFIDAILEKSGYPIISFHASVRRHKEFPNTDRIPEEYRGKRIEWIENIY
ncbi:MAG: hypothetical protein V1870_02225 [Candidatus Aenigmatarchaeota archaeon]